MRLPAERIPTIPAPVRAVLRNVVWAYGWATSPFRPLPGFLVIGAQKAGTTALYAYLRQHPTVTGPSWKEVSFFDRHYARGEAWPGEVRAYAKLYAGKVRKDWLAFCKARTQGAFAELVG